MKVRRKGVDDCCCNDWKNKIKELWEKYQDVVRGVKFGDNPVSWPDGDGIVQVDTEGLIDVDHTLNKNSINPVANAPVATAIETLETTDQAIENDVLTLSGAIDNINDALGGFDEDISVLSGRISTVYGKVDLQNSYNAATRAIANSAQQTAETFDDRLDSVEESDAIQDQQIAALQDADAENAKLSGDNAFTGNNSFAGNTTFAVNPKAANPASGAVDTSVVNANWVSQTGDSAPNNLIHRRGFETFETDKQFGNAERPDNASLLIWSSGAYRRIRMRSNIDDCTTPPTADVSYGLINYSDKNDLTAANIILTHKSSGGFVLRITLRDSSNNLVPFILGETS